MTSLVKMTSILQFGWTKSIQKSLVLVPVKKTIIMKTDIAPVAEFSSISFTISASLWGFRLRLVMVDKIMTNIRMDTLVSGQNPSSRTSRNLIFLDLTSLTKFARCIAGRWAIPSLAGHNLSKIDTESMNFQDMSTVQENNGNHHCFGRIQIRYFEIFWSSHLSTPPMFLLHWGMIYGSGTMMCLFSDELYLETLVTGLTPTASKTLDRDFIALLTGCLLLVMPSLFSQLFWLNICHIAWFCLVE